MIQARGVSIGYPGRPPAVTGVDLDLHPGERINLLGRSGAGKSTLALALGGLLVPAAGWVEVDGFSAGRRAARREIAARVGFLFQNPETQLLTARVADEIALGLENLGWPPARIDARVAGLLAVLDLERLKNRAPRTLSGGEMQRVALAAALAPEPRYLMLDEPTAHLDSLSAREVERAIEGAVATSRALRLDLAPIPDDSSRAGVLAPAPGSRPVRYVVLEEGRIAYDGSAPLPPALARLLAGGEDPDRAEPLGELSPRPSQVLLRARGLTVGWGGHAVGRDIDLELRSGIVTHIEGRSGAGKSTLVFTLAGLHAPLGGTVEVEPAGSLGERVSCVFQFAERLFYRPTVREELGEYCGATGGSGPESIRLALDFVGLPAPILERSPLQLSGGEVRRLAFAAGLVSRRPVLVLDEPAAGLDGPGRRLLKRLIRSFAAEGGAVLLVGHDLEFAELAGERWLLAGGRLLPAPGLRAGAGDIPAFRIRSEGGAGRERPRPPSPERSGEARRARHRRWPRCAPGRGGLL